jgi:hypothetical protein
VGLSIAYPGGGFDAHSGFGDFYVRDGFDSGTGLALQLPSCFEVRALGDCLVSSAPEGPCDGVCGLNPLSIKSDGNAANFLD